MWLSFFSACFFVVLLLYLPGFFLLYAVGLQPKRLTVVCAPVVSTALIALSGTIVSKVGIHTHPFLLVGLMLLVGFGAATIRCAKQRKAYRAHIHHLSKRQCITKMKYLLPYAVCVGLSAALTLAIFVKALDGPDSFFQAYDNSFHINLIRTFINSDNISCFNTSAYSTDVPALPSPYKGEGSFYPCAWHGLVTITCLFTGITIPEGINVVNTVLIALVFPLSMMSLLELILPQRRLERYVAACVPLAFVSSAWSYVSFGPLYPMLLSTAFVPAVCSIFISLISDEKLGLRNRLVLGFVFVLGGIALALSQPSGIFLAGLLLAPCCVRRAMGYAAARGLSRKLRWLVGIGTTAVIAVVWLGCYMAPPFKAVVSHNWPATTTFFQGAIDAFLWATTWNAAQPLLTIFVIAGVVVAIETTSVRWLLVPWALTGLTYVLSAGSEGALKHILGGFWYTDPHRLEVNYAIAAMPLAVLGATLIIRLIKNAFDKNAQTVPFCPSGRLAMGIVSLGTIALIFSPSFYFDGIGTVETAFGRLHNIIESENNRQGPQVLTDEELEFSLEAIALVPQGERIVNEPNDGSGFLYGLDGANIVYRSFALPDITGESDESQLIRMDLDELENNPHVSEALRYLGAHYVLILDQGESLEDKGPRFWSYYPEQWSGIETIDDATPGFSVMLSRGDMRLYRIEV